MLANRLEPKLLPVQNDKYFHCFIGFHLKKSKLFHYFPKLFFDLGFIEEKLRLAHLPNTVGDLEKYREFIIRNNPDDDNILLDEIIDFILHIDVIIHKSIDTNLIQCAISSKGKLREEAINQAALYTNRVWMDDM